jgi:hypothetical protein
VLICRPKWCESVVQQNWSEGDNLQRFDNSWRIDFILMICCIFHGCYDVLLPIIKLKKKCLATTMFVQQPSNNQRKKYGEVLCVYVCVPNVQVKYLLFVHNRVFNPHSLRMLWTSWWMHWAIISIVRLHCFIGCVSTSNPGFNYYSLFVMMYVTYSVGLWPVYLKSPKTKFKYSNFHTPSVCRTVL